MVKQSDRIAMFRAIVLALAFSSGNCCAAFTNSVIDLQKSDGLEAILDGGLHPWRSRGMEKDQIEVGPTDVTVVLPTSEAIHLSIENASFKVLEGNKLSTCSFIGNEGPLAQVAELTKSVCISLGESPSGIDQLVSNVGTRSDPEKYWTTGPLKKGPVRVVVRFQPIFHLDRVTAQLYVSVQWMRPLAEMKFRREPIEPPKGYEGSFVEPPPPTTNDPLPLKGADYYRDIIYQSQIASGPNSPPNASQPTSIAKKEPNSRSYPVKSGGLGWIIAAGIALALALWLIIQRTRRSGRH
jgi:hypothetical protein